MPEVIWARRAEALHQTLTLVRSLGLFDSRLSQQVRSTCGRGAIGHLASFPGDRIAPSSSPSCLLSRAALPISTPSAVAPHPGWHFITPILLAKLVQGCAMVSPLEAARFLAFPAPSRASRRAPPLSRYIAAV